jgi:mRNA-degrading endonuclease RelE of RelBE toxin-antitoxin system
MREHGFTLDDDLPKSIQKFIASRDRKTQAAIFEAFDAICHSPFHHSAPRRIRRLRGKLNGLLRYQLDDIRIIYRVDVAKHLISIEEVDDRGDIY